MNKLIKSSNNIYTDITCWKHNSYSKYCFSTNAVYFEFQINSYEIFLYVYIGICIFYIIVVFLFAVVSFVKVSTLEESMLTKWPNFL